MIVYSYMLRMLTRLYLLIPFFHPLPFHPLPFHPLPFHPLPFHPLPFHPLPFHPLPFHPLPFHPLPFHPLPFHPLPFHPLPFHPLPFHPRYHSPLKCYHPLRLPRFHQSSLPLHLLHHLFCRLYMHPNLCKA